MQTRSESFPAFEQAMNMNKPTLLPVFCQHAEEVAFLWTLRDAAVYAPHYDLDDLATHDHRVEAHVDGLRVAADAGWELVLEAAERHKEAGEAFAAGVLAMESRDKAKIDAVLKLTEAERESQRGLISALGWVGREALKGTGLELLSGGPAFRRRLGIAACAVQRVDPGETLGRALADDDPALRACALRAAGQLGRVDLLPALLERLDDADPSCAFRAAWSAVRLGDRKAALQRLALLALADDSPFQPAAAEIAPRAMAGGQARELLGSQARNPKRRRAVIRAVGASGDPHYVPWLIRQMETVEVARVAGEAFAMITGADLAYEDLERDWPEGFEAGPTEDPADENVDLDPDEDLPWPEPERVQAWWQARAGQFEAGRRYLAGRPVEAAGCREVLAAGFQRQRRAAALELALMDPKAPLFETRAPGFRQQKLLAQGGRAA